MGYDREPKYRTERNAHFVEVSVPFFYSTSVTAECLLVGDDTGVVDTDKNIQFFFRTRLGMTGR